MANCYTAIELGVEVMPVLNKMDLPQADPEGARQEVEDVIGIDASQAVLASAKTGMGIDEILESIVARVPAPKGIPRRAAGADHRLVVRQLRGRGDAGAHRQRRAQAQDKILLMASGATHLCEQTGVFTPKSQQRPHLSAGEVGFIIAGIKQLEDAKVGDTVTLANKPAAARRCRASRKSSCRCSPACTRSKARNTTSCAIRWKSSLNDAALMFEPEVSQALGFGFRCGFLGLLHMEIVQERLEREFDMDIITTAPSVVYEVEQRDGSIITVESPSRMPEVGKIADIREPIVKVTLFMPQDYVGPVMTLCNNKRGVQVNMSYHGRQVHLVYEIPLAEIVLDFFDKPVGVARLRLDGL